MGCCNILFKTRYGYVTTGKYTGCKITLIKQQKVHSLKSDTFSEIIFFNIKNGFKEYKHKISIDVEGIKLLFPNKIGYHCLMIFSDGCECEFDLYRSKAYRFVEHISKGIQKDMTDMF